MISRILYDKGYREYVSAAKEINKSYKNVRFLLLGDIDSAYPNAVPKEQVSNDHEAGFIEYLGYVKEVRPVILNSDCIVLPSYYNEGLSRVLMEGLAMSKPIITTNQPGCKEAVDEGVNGFLCEPKDIESLVTCITKFLSLSESQRIEMGNNSRLKAEKQFDIKKVIEIYDRIIIGESSV